MCSLLTACVTTLTNNKTDPDHQNPVSDERPFGGTSPAALYRASRDPREEPSLSAISPFIGILQAVAFSIRSSMGGATAK
ncbi:hypothetical protein [Mesorhizobium sp. WSM3868]|uniref:hypothetical protein n=1 Tax=Mesorhizobium sp. WSM3868 TaxID=2029405 RepID=UPI00117DCF48|nr:hypothetical protein [Mesorhizobium sp. WSM3868]